jgi:glycerol-3-phosphate dehydrogenase (NAD(P)+)
MTTVAVLGAGSWGSALADLLARKGHTVRLWAYEADVATAINTRHENTVYFAGAKLHAGVVADTELATCLAGAEAICSVVPSHVTRSVLRQAAPHVVPGTPLVCATKGMETDTLEFMNEVAAEAIPHATFVALSGPSFAEEVHQQQPTAIVAASSNAPALGFVQQLFSTATFRVYSNSDVIGVELGGSLKNTMAIATGILEGLGLGHNPRAALLTRGLAEMSRLGVALGAKTDTFAGLAGMGDLILTCTGDLSRNRQLGVALSKGITLDEYRATHRTVAEGVNTALAASRLAERYQVEMPITRQVAAILFEGAAPRDCIQTLMERTLKAERWG